MKPETQAKKFIEANNRHPYIHGVWLDKNRRPDCPVNECEFFRVRLCNGQIFTLSKEAHQITRELGHELR